MEKIVKALKKVKLKNLIILVILLAFNTYAWFIYTTKVSTGMEAHVSAWDVQFIGKDGGITTELIIEVDRIYPGMQDFEQEITVQNHGEVNIQLEYEIKSLKILDEYYEVTEDGTLTSEEIETNAKTNYPFKINIEKDDTLLQTAEGDGSFNVTVTWEYESGQDELDTEWGTKAYEFYSTHPDEKCIEMKLILKAVQKAQ